MNGLNSDIYLDSNATTKVLPEAANEAYSAMEELFGNPSSSHITGLRARHILESARKLIRQVLGISSGRVIFTSGATEAIQTAIFSTLCTLRKTRTNVPDPGRLLLYCATEHKAVPEALVHWNETLGIGNDVISIPVDEQGRIDLDFLREHAPRADMVCTMAVNNETGVIHDLRAIEETLRSHNEGATWMVDSVQAVGKIDLELAETSIDYAAVSGHKIHAAKGIGLLYVRDGAPLTPLIAGGGQEHGARSGTENLPGVAALGTVFKFLADPNDATFKDNETLTLFRDRLIKSLNRAFPSIVYNTPFETAVPTTINFSVEGFSSKELLDLFDAAGMRVSSGSACGSALQGSYVLDAMHMPKWQSEGAIRLSFGITSTDTEITSACHRIEEAGKALCESCLVISNDLYVSASEPIDGLVQLKRASMCSWVLIDKGTRQCIVMDPFAEFAQRIETLVRCQQCEMLAILDTHLHVDHESCRPALLNALKDRIPSGGTDALGWPDKCHDTVTLGDDSEAPCIRFGFENIIACTPLPGHTEDGVAYLVGTPDAAGRLNPEDVRFAFTGDTLQIGGIGRTDFSSSSTEAIYESVQKLNVVISNDTVICPTHDYSNGFSTTLDTEQRTQPLLARILDPIAPLPIDEFAAEKAKLDKTINDESNSELVCGAITGCVTDKSSIDIRPDELQSFFEQHKDSLIIDVREPHEYKFAQDWSMLGLDAPPENVPLTRFSNFLDKILHQPIERDAQDIIFLCRSGTRSSKAAEVLRRMGFTNAYSIAGGIALGTTHHEVDLHDIDEAFYII